MNLEELQDLLPETVQQIAGLIGFPATMSLIDKLGGTTFPFGKGIHSLGANRLNLLRQTIGCDNTEKLMADFGGDVLYIPRCAEAMREWRNRKLIERFDELTEQQELSSLMALSQICPEFGLSDRHVWNILGMHGRTSSSQQGSLF